MSTEFETWPIDEPARQSLASAGLRLGLVDTKDIEAFGAWMQADIRGFHGPVPDEEALQEQLAGVAYRRTTGVWDGDSATPVGTVNSWPVELAVPGERGVQAWAISSVTVAPTHRRRGIARNLLEAELRTAAALRVPLAILTVSESTIYSRFGFSAGAFATTVTIDTRRSGWRGPQAPGRLSFISLEEFAELVAEQHERSRLSSPGQIEVWDQRWKQISGLSASDKERRKSLRAVRYDDTEGALQGLALYRVIETGADFTGHKVSVDYLSSATDEAYAALWRYVLEIDLTTEVSANLRSVDEAVLWQLVDRRSATVSAWDHLWLRILDVPRSLQARSYSGPARLGFEVADDLGFATGTWLLEVGSDGEGEVTAVSALPEEVAAVALSVNELGALYLGGVAATTLLSAGRLRELSPGAAAAVDRTFRAERAPWLSVWF